PALSAVAAPLSAARRSRRWIHESHLDVHLDCRVLHHWNATSDVTWQGEKSTLSLARPALCPGICSCQPRATRGLGYRDARCLLVGRGPCWLLGRPQRRCIDRTGRVAAR